jgi:hypothetical protein
MNYVKDLEEQEKKSQSQNKKILSLYIVLS